MKNNKTFGHRTTNCIESFFSTVKRCVNKKQSLATCIFNLLTVVISIQSENLKKNVRNETTIPVNPTPIPSGLSSDYKSLLTDKAFKKIVSQMQLVVDGKVEVVDSETVMCGGQPIHPTHEYCTCPTFSNQQLPCRHMLALQIHNHKTTYLPHAVAARHTRTYNTPFKRRFIHQQTPNTPTINTFQAASRKEPLAQDKKYKTCMETLKVAASLISKMGTEDFHHQHLRCQQFVKSVREGTRFQEPTTGKQWIIV